MLHVRPILCCSGKIVISEGIIGVGDITPCGAIIYGRFPTYNTAYITAER